MAATTYRIVCRGALGDSALRPFIDDFVRTNTDGGDTCLIGGVIDPAHLHGLILHLTACNAEIVRIDPVTDTQGTPS